MTRKACFAEETSSPMSITQLTISTAATSTAATASPGIASQSMPPSFPPPLPLCLSMSGSNSSISRNINILPTATMTKTPLFIMHENNPRMLPYDRRHHLNRSRDLFMTTPSSSQPPPDKSNLNLTAPSFGSNMCIECEGEIDGNESNINEANNKNNYNVIRRKQKRILLVRHALECTAMSSSRSRKRCAIPQQCSVMKSLLNHIRSCREDHCVYPNCRFTRYVITHYRKCKDSTCEVCEPVRDSIRKSTLKKEKQKQRQQRATTTRSRPPL